MTAIDLINAERQRQIEKGYDAEHDDGHVRGELAVAASCFALDAAGFGNEARDAWPWSDAPMGDGTTLEQLAKTGAMVVAEIERRLRRERK